MYVVVHVREHVCVCVHVREHVCVCVQGFRVLVCARVLAGQRTIKGYMDEGMYRVGS